MAMLSRLALLAALSAGSLPAQQGVGISVTPPLSSAMSLLCGFDCSAVGNTHQSTVPGGQTVTAVLFGDAGMPGVLMLGLGPTLPSCPGLTLPGIHNSLLILPPNLVVSLGVSLAPGARSRCGPTLSGSVAALSNVQTPPAAAGLTLSWQGLVFDQGMPAFTRAEEMTVQ